jgi:hypothetical protein
MPLTKANYKLPEQKKKNIDKKTEEHLERKKFEDESMRVRGATGSFMIFKEEGLEDVFVVDDLD